MTKDRRVAILADIHGNIEALEAVLAHVSRMDVDRLAVAGDIVNFGTDSLACWERVQALGCPVVSGNHERYVADYGTPAAKPEWSTERFLPLQWTARQFSDAERERLGAIPFAVSLATDLLMVHASTRSEYDSISPFTSARELEDMFGGTRGWVVRGHNHMCFQHELPALTVLAVGSVGLPMTGVTTAQYAVLERRDGNWQVWHQSVPYDLDAALARFRASGLLEEGGPMARLLLRELATATPQMVPFLRHYERWTQGGRLTLEEAVKWFLTAY